MADLANVLGVSRFVRRSAATLGKVLLILPDMKAVTDGATPNSFSNVNDAGFLTPSGTPTLALASVGTGNIDPDTYTYAVTFYDSVTGHEGPHVTTATIVVSSLSNVVVTLTPITNEGTNTRVTHFRIYRNGGVGSTDFYRVATVAIASGTHTDDMTNVAWLAVGAAGSVLGSGVTANTAPVAQTYGIVMAHRGWGFMAAPWNGVGGTAYDHKGAISRVGNMDSWPADSEFEVESGGYGVLRAMVPQGDDVIYYKDSAVAVLRFTKDPNVVSGDGVLKVIERARGAVNQKCVIDMDGVHYVMDQEGIYVHSNGFEINDITRRIRKHFWPRINWAVSHKFHAVHNYGTLRFFVALDSDTAPHHAFCLDLFAMRAGRGVHWWPEYYLHGITGSCRTWRGSPASQTTYFKASRTRAATVITANGHLFDLDKGYRDGLHPYLLAEGTVKTGSTPTTTGIQAEETHTYGFALTTPASGSASVVGCYVWFPDSGQYAEITDYNNGTPLSLTFTALAQAPAVGERFVIGPIAKSYWRTPHLRVRDERNLADPRRRFVRFKFRPTSISHFMGVSFLRDRQPVAHKHTVDTEASDATKVRGLKFTSGTSQVQVFMGGHVDTEGGLGEVSVEIPRPAGGTVQVELDFSGVDKPSQVDSMGLVVGDG